MSNQVSDKQAYEWVKTGHWSLAMFREWLSTYNSNGLHDDHGGNTKCCQGGPQWGHARDCESLP